jgi:hypothetical protein
VAPVPGIGVCDRDAIRSLVPFQEQSRQVKGNQPDRHARFSHNDATTGALLEC